MRSERMNRESSVYNMTARYNSVLQFACCGFVLLAAVRFAAAGWIIPVNAVASAEMGGAANDYALHTIDGSGLSEESTNGVHAAGPDYSWSFVQGDGIAVKDEFITFDLGSIYTVTNAHIWQFTRNVTGADANRGVKTFDILVSSDNTNFTEVVTNATLNKCIDVSPADGMPDGNEPVQTKSFFAKDVRYIKFGIDLTYENSGTQDWQGGLGEVRFEGFKIPKGTLLVIR